MTARERFASARVARLATTDAAGNPHLIPICFALDGDTLYTAVDHKPKTSTNLQRVRNIRENPYVAVLADHYKDDDWSALWWVRADGKARIVEPGNPEHNTAITLLTERYLQYSDNPPAGPVIAVEITSWSSWHASGEQT